jgi:protein required for attachment to host cells
MRNWILIADASRASVFVPHPDRKELERVREFSDPLGRAHSADLATDRPGRTRAATPGGSFAPAMAAHTDPRAAEAERFARHIAIQLAVAHGRYEFNQLALIAPAHFLGLLRHALDGQVAKTVVSSVPMDLTPIPHRDLWPHVGDVTRAFSHLAGS